MTVLIFKKIKNFWKHAFQYLMNSIFKDES